LINKILTIHQNKMIGTDGLPVQLEISLFSAAPRFSARIDFPDNYPDTPFRRAYDHICELNAFLNTRRDELGIRSFYVYTSRHISRLASREERRLTRGLGRDMLCMLTRYLLEEGLVTEDTRVELEASGGKCFEEDLETFDMSEEEMDRVLARFPDNVQDEIDHKRRKGLLPELTLEEKKQWVCAYTENQFLVEYYERYGLQAEESEDMFSTPMTGTIRGIMEAC
jgi:hypothetical protein